MQFLTLGQVSCSLQVRREVDREVPETELLGCEFGYLREETSGCNEVAFTLVKYVDG